MKKQEVKFHHKVITKIVKAVLYPYIRIRYRFHYKKYKLKKGQNYLIVSNHQCEGDQFFLEYLFNKPLYFVATDTMFPSKRIGNLLHYLVNPILKEKGMPDFAAIKKIIGISKEGGNIAIFLEGNRSYGEFQFNIDEATVKLIKKLNLPVLFVHINGGYGVKPRFGYKFRKGKVRTEVVKCLNPDEYTSMSDEELLNVVKDGVRVYDSDEGLLYKSKIRAEYLERELFVCPKCGKMNHLTSKGEYIECDCGLKVEYQENLTFKSDDPNFKFNKMVDWYNYQKEYIKNMELPEGVIFEDEVTVLKVFPNFDRKKIFEGKIQLYKDELVIGGQSFPVKDIVMASPIAGTKLDLKINDQKYFIKGNERFNPLKYCLIFHKLDTQMKNIDKYFSLD